MEFKEGKWNICKECNGEGKKKPKHRKKIFNPIKPIESQHSLKQNTKLYPCIICSGTGLIHSDSFPEIDNNKFPSIAIIGAGIGGVALAVACLHRGIPFTLYERDNSFDARSQGYGLTLQQASKAIEGLGILELKKGIISTRHVVHNTEGKILGEWGFRKWMKEDSPKVSKRINIHIARQELRLEILNQLIDQNTIKWGHQLTEIQTENSNIELHFLVNGNKIIEKANIVVGADGIRSTVRKLIIPENISPLQYLNCIVILGICPLKNLENVKSDLLDSATVFQTANGNERIYVMPFSSDSVMWQLSFPISENEAKKLSSEGRLALKNEAIKRTMWHSPIPEIIKETPLEFISGYPVYDRELLKSDLFENAGNITLIGDAAHPMSPFKGQGANQAILDALSLARNIYKKCNEITNWKAIDLRKEILNPFENEMIERSASKVIGSAEAAKFLHSEVVLKEGNVTRGSFIKNIKTD